MDKPDLIADLIDHPIDSLAFVAGGGEMGARIRAVDWSKTPLGPVESWPQSLKTCVRIILTSRQPMFVWWGDTLVNLYNDAYKTIVGGKHPEALGQPASVVWREIWDQVGPRAESTMRGNEGTYDEALLLIMERNGYPEETYYTFSYSPVPNDHGGTGGIICANTDDTQRIIGERQMALLRELAARTVDARTWEEACTLSALSLMTNAKDLPFAMIYLVDSERRSVFLAGTSGIERGHRAAPESVLIDEGSVWPFAEVLRTHATCLVEVENLAPPVGSSVGPLPTGAWQQPPTHAAAVPIAASGQTGRAGILIVGLNRFRLFDENYSSFLGLVAGQISASIANAQAYEEEKKRAEALAEIDRAKTAFFSNVSHEFRTPLTLMLGPTEDALQSPERALRGVELETVHRNELRLLKLVNTLLDFSRIEAGRVQASYEPTDLAALTGDLASAFRSAIERGGLAFEVACPPLPQTVHVDREMWEKIVFNLLSNAFKFTFEGAIRIALRSRGSHVELAVSDTGVGIPEHELANVFRRFHRIEGTQSRTHEGSGIGLALVHDLVQLHGGTIEVTSRLGQGTTFTVAIPTGTAHLPADRIGARRTLASTGVSAESYVAEALRWLPAEPAEQPATQLRPGVSLPPTIVPGAARVLVADDNADMRDYVSRLLEQHWTVEAVADGARALAAVRSRRPDLILTDVMMPNLDGFELLRALRADTSTSSIPVIMLSARAGEESRIEGLQAGADDYLAKPFSAKELLARVATHLELGRLRRLAELEREKLHGLFEQAPVSIAVYEGPAHRVVLFNAKYRELLGADQRSAFQGQPLVDVIPELAGQPFVEVLDQVYRTGEPHMIADQQLELGDGKGSTEERYFTTYVHPVRSIEGRVTGVMTVGNEVTALVRSTRERERLLNSEQEARMEAERASRAKDEFLAMLGHELRNPLAPILTALQLMRLRGTDKVEKERTIIERQVTHLVRLIDDLLDVSRITRGKIELKKERIELAEVVAKAIEMASPLLEQREHNLTVNVPRRGLAVDGDPARLAQVLSNLLTNAAKYTEHGGRIAVTAVRRGDEAVIEVSDTGIGIAPEMLPVVFDMFVQERQALDRSQGGLGLGLTIVRSLVVLHGGSVGVRSEGKGCGSVFTVRLPLSVHEPGALAGATPGALGDVHAAGKERRRVLVVDDNEDAAEMMSDYLRAMGHTIHVAHDGPAALRAVAELAPEVALLDIGLPVMDGYELARRLREQPGLERVYLVAITGYGQEIDRQRSQLAGFDAHLVKPIDIGRLEQLLEELGTGRAPQ